MADITREEIERIRDVANTSSNPAIHVADIISICDLALSALAPAAEPTREPDAWLYTCGKPGLRSTWASIDANDASHWPIDQWTNGYEKRPLYLASPIQPLGVLHQTPDGRVFKSFPSTDAAQTPNVAPPVHAQVVRDVLEGVIKVCEAAALQIGDEYYGTSSKGCANAFRALLRWHESQTAPVPPRAEEPVCNRCGLMGEDIPMCDKVDCDQRDVLYKGSKVHPQAPSEALAWVRVPKDASKAMLAAGLNEMDENDHDYCISGPAGLALVWDAMLDTAPSAGTPEEPRHAD